jgi:hypothetical protein
MYWVPPDRQLAFPVVDALAVEETTVGGDVPFRYSRVLV